MPQRLSLTLAGAMTLTGVLLATAPQSATPTLGVDGVQPGMVGVGRTVFAGETIEEFKATILGTLKNVIGPGRNLIIAKLEGGPLASTGVIAGMSGSPVYIDGKLIGAVSYFARIVPQGTVCRHHANRRGEMIDAVDAPGAAQGSNPGLALPPGATRPAQVFGILRRAMDGATAPLGAAAGRDAAGSCKAHRRSHRSYLDSGQSEAPLYFRVSIRRSDPTCATRSPRTASPIRVSRRRRGRRQPGRSDRAIPWVSVWFAAIWRWAPPER